MGKMKMYEKRKKKKNSNNFIFFYYYFYLFIFKMPHNKRKSARCLSGSFIDGGYNECTKPKPTKLSLGSSSPQQTNDYVLFNGRSNFSQEQGIYNSVLFNRIDLANNMSLCGGSKSKHIDSVIDYSSHQIDDSPSNKTEKKNDGNVINQSVLLNISSNNDSSVSIVEKHYHDNRSSFLSDSAERNMEEKGRVMLLSSLSSSPSSSSSLSLSSGAIHFDFELEEIETVPVFFFFSFFFFVYIYIFFL
jgi:hypothetical protein